MSGSSRRPKRRQIRYLIAHAAATGHRYYWQPPTKLRGLADRPAWLRTTALGTEPASAVAEAEKLNAKLDTWRSPRSRKASGIQAMMAAYLDHSRFKALAPRTKHDYERHLEAIREDFAGAEPGDVTPVVLDRYREKLLRDSTLGERQVLYRFQVLRLLFAWGRRTGWVKGENPARALGLKQPASRSKRVWSLEQLRALTAADATIGLAIRLSLYTLQRQGDVLAAQWTHIRNGALHVVQGKTGTQLWLPIHPQLARALDGMPARSDFIISTQRGQRYTSAGFRSQWGRGVDSLPKPRPTFHDIRGTAVSLLRAGRLPDEDVMLWTGHKRQGATAILDAYDARLSDLAERAFPIMDGWKV